LAEALGLPVATTPTGKGCFPENHPLALGPMGAHGTPVANACVGDADLVLAVGSKLSAYDTAYEHPDLIDPERQTLIQVEVEPKNAAWTFPVEHALVGDAALVLRQLLAAAKTTDGAARVKAGEARVAVFRAKYGYFDGAAYRDAASPVHPQRAIGELIRNLPPDSIVTLDAGENRIFMNHFYQTRAASSFLQAAGAGPMGYAIPAALGAKLVHPDRVCVAVAGDGGFAMTMNGLMTALEQDIPIIVVVFNNRALGWVKHGPSPFSDFRDFDHAAIARAMGCRGVRVEDGDALGVALREAVSARVPTVIDVVMSLDALTYSDVTSPLMKPPLNAKTVARGARTQ
jgi:acetolactate synthase-1/2/3 large subunit